jgi:pyruvate dehydrogenase E2 component (dihydrolipoamide acetyltransferase)
MPIEVLMPSLSPTMEEGNIAKWIKKEGDKISSGDIIAEVETDKAIMEVEALDNGILGKIIKADGAQGVKVNEIIALILKEGEDKSSLDGYVQVVKQSPSAATAVATNDVKTTNVQQVQNIQKTESRVIASPLAKRIAQNEGVDISSVVGTGPRGRVVKDDVLNAKSSGSSRSKSVQLVRNDVETHIVPHTMVRKIIAKRLLESKQNVPHFYLSAECDVSMLSVFRDDINSLATNDAQGKPSYKISVNDIIIKACAMALRDVPEANASWSDDGMIVYNNVDISVAVSTDGGLLTPIIRNADMKDLKEISGEMKSLAKRARENKLQPHEFQGGGFSISNLGMYGVDNFQAIINPPQAAILSVGKTTKKPVVNKHNQIVIGEVMNITISCDHRVIDGSLCAILLEKIKRNIERPYLLYVD